ncbi:uncharacterized protein DNG_10158 [Cephalotrichum gorgonifer]|uniref:Peptidase S8/S53 domain-containing protein n=1 Tax=Cephalotrichum gorgonifer TaxID=2041049 RepID=A0AAE8N808_9PEZI|nr:uncharacterized protein DNG_10158 [Cephalotrichum gorgonifer]
MRDWVKRLAIAIEGLNEKGVFVVTGSGNNRIANEWPAWFGAKEGSMNEGFGKDPIYIKDLLVVGAADALTRDRWTMSGVYKELGLPHMYGPGVNVIGVDGDKARWASHDHGREYKVTRGTSVATAYTAGMAAYYLKLHQLGRLPSDNSGNQPDMSPGGLKRYLLDKAWSRFENPEYGHINGLWNSAYPHSVKSSNRCAYDKAVEEGGAAMRMFRCQTPEQGQTQGDFLILEDQCVTGEDSPAEASTPDETDKPNETDDGADDADDADNGGDAGDASDTNDTQEPEKPPPSCNLHIHEFYNTVQKDYFHVEYRFFNGKQDDPADEGAYDVKYNEEHLVTAEDTGLAHHIVVNLYKEGDDEDCFETGKLPPGGKIQKSKRACGEKYWDNHQVKLKYGSLAWDSQSDQDKNKTPHCQVGGWDMLGNWDGQRPLSPNRQMDCRFPC